MSSPQASGVREARSPRELRNARRAALPVGHWRDWAELMLIDHGFLRALYRNRFRLAGGLHRANQPSPGILRRYRTELGIKSVVNLRGEHDHLGWYRLERRTCQELGLNLLTTTVNSRELLEPPQILALAEFIRGIPLPAVVQCKSGADRAGFFRVLYRHIRLGEPIEDAAQELHWFYGHFKSAKTGVLDHFFHTYLAERRPHQSFLSWVEHDYEKARVQASFKPVGSMAWLVDKVLRRE